MTFCAYYLDCEDGSDCPRALTNWVENEARRIGIGIMQYASPPTCHKPMTEGNEFATIRPADARGKV
jgi:hypothetical protein